jgi:hypothetical protein
MDHATAAQDLAPLVNRTAEELQELLDRSLLTVDIVKGALAARRKAERRRAEEAAGLQALRAACPDPRAGDGFPTGQYGPFGTAQTPDDSTPGSLNGLPILTDATALSYQ